MKELKEKAYAAFKQKYNELPADHGFPVVRERHDGVYFARNTDDWHDFAKGQKFFGNLVTFIFVAVLSIVAVVAADLLFVRNHHQLLLVALGAYAIVLVLVAVLVACRRPKITAGDREILFYDEYKNKIYVIAL